MRGRGAHSEREESEIENSLKSVSRLSGQTRRNQKRTELWSHPILCSLCGICNSPRRDRFACLSALSDTVFPGVTVSLPVSGRHCLLLSFFFYSWPLLTLLWAPGTTTHTHTLSHSTLSVSVSAFRCHLYLAVSFIKITRSVFWLVGASSWIPPSRILFQLFGSRILCLKKLSFFTDL